MHLTLKLTGLHGVAEMLQSANARQADQILQLQAEAMQTQAVAVDNARLQKEIAQSQKVGTALPNMATCCLLLIKCNPLCIVAIDRCVKAVCSFRKAA